jgi:hypothetical protein
MRSALLIASLAVLWGVPSFAADGEPSAAESGAVAPDLVAHIVSGMIADAIPRDYEKRQDWGKTKEITTGLEFKGHPWDPKIDRQETEVNDGVWKHYKVSLVDPNQNLTVNIEDLRSLEAGHIAFRLVVTAKVHGWAQARVYETGIPLGTYTAEGDSRVNLAIDSDIALETTPSSFLTGIAIKPHVSAAQVKLDEFHLTRFGELKGALAHDLGDGLKHLVEDELDGPKLVDKLNHALEKKQKKLVITPEKLLGLKAASKQSQ